MTAPPGGADGGRIDVEVKGDTSGFAKDLKAQIEAKTRNIKAKIQATVDARRLATELKVATAAAEKQAQIKVKLGVDSAHLGRELQKALRQATKDAGGFTVKVGVDIDDRQLQRRIDAAVRDRVIHISTKVDADTGEADAQVDGFRKRQESNPVNIPVKADSKGLSGLSDSLGKLGKVGLIAGGVQAVTTAVTALGGSLIAVVGAASQAVGALAAIPNAAGLVAQGVGVLLAGFSGVGDAVKAMGSVQKGAAKSAAQSAASQEAAAKRISDAQKAVARAVQDADRTQVEGAKKVADARKRLADVEQRASSSIQSAERSLASAQKESMRAQQDLTKAREDAREKLDDLGLSLKGAALDEESAALAVERAQKNLNDVNTNPGSTDLDRRQADLDFREAQQRLAEIKESNDDLRKEADDAFKKGVDGADNVVAAQDRVTDANQNVADAEQNLADTRTQAASDVADAQANLSDTIQQTAQDNADAQQKVTDAQDNLSEAMKQASLQAAEMTSAMSTLDAAMQNLSPAGQEFAKFVYNTLRPRMQQLRSAVQEALLPPLQTAITKAMPLLDTLQTGLVGTAKVMGDVAVKGADVVASPMFRGDVKTIMDSNNRAMGLFGQAAVNLLQPLASIAQAAAPLLERFAKFTVHLSEMAAASVQAGRETGKLDAFMQRAGDRAAQLGDIVANVVVGLFNMGKAGTDSGDSLLTKLDQLTKKFREWSGSTDGQDKLHKFFADMQPITEKLIELVGNLAHAFVVMGQNGGGAMSGFLDTLNFLLRVINDILDSPFGPFVSAILTVAGAAGAIALVAKWIGGIAGSFKAIGGLVDKITGGGKNSGGSSGPGDTVSKGAQEVFWRKCMPVDLCGPVKCSCTGGGGGGGGDEHTTSGGTSAGSGSGSTSSGHGRGARAGAAVGGAAATAAGLLPDVSGWQAVALNAVSEFADEAGAKLGEWAGKLGPKIAGVASSFVTFAKGLNLSAIASKALAAAQWLLDAAMDANPIGILIVAIGALVAAFIWAWNNVDGFKEGVMAVLSAIGGFFVTVFTHIKDFFVTVWNAIWDFFSGILGNIRDFFVGVWQGISDFFVGLWTGISNFFQGIWNGIVSFITTVFNGIVTFFQTVGNTIATWWNGLWTGISNFFTTIWNGIVSFFQGVWNGISSFFQTVGNAIASWWSGFWDGISSVAHTIFQAVHDFIGGLLDGIGNAFKTVVNVIGSVWDTLKAILRAPIEAIVDVVYNKGIRTVWNWINNLWDGDDLPEVHVPQFATGGVVPGGYKPGKDTVAAMLSPGEGILVPEATKALGGAAGIQAINAQYSSRVSGPNRNAVRPGTPASQENHGKPLGFDLGGILSGIGGAIGSGWDWVTDKVGDVVGTLSSLVSKGWQFAVHAALSPLHGLINTLFPDGNMVTGGFGKAANAWLDKVEAAVGGKETEQAAKAVAAAGPVGDAVGRWAPLVNQVLGELGQSTSLAPWVLQLIQHESGGNPAAINRTDSNALAGHPSQGLMQTIPGTFNAYAGPYRAAGILDPHANIYAGLNYGISRYGSVANIPGIKSLMAGGGYKPYDTGGPWAPGTLGGNFSGQTEGVLTGSGVTQLGHDVMQLLNSGGSLVDLVQRASPGQLSAGGNNIGVLIESGAIQLVWNGDKPTSTQETLNVGLRTLANLGLFDAGPGGGR